MPKTLFLLLGITFGVFIFLTYESNAPSYLSRDSKSCANCHVMLSAYNTWEKSSHRPWTECVDCHIPHENFIRKYTAKASDGMRHAFAFTFNTYDQVIRAGKTAQHTVQSNCIRCHEKILLPIPSHNADLLTENTGARLCWECHREVPHGKGNSISTYKGIHATEGKVADFINKQKTKEDL